MTDHRRVLAFSIPVVTGHGASSRWSLSCAFTRVPQQISTTQLFSRPFRYNDLRKTTFFYGCCGRQFDQPLNRQIITDGSQVFANGQQKDGFHVKGSLPEVDVKNAVSTNHSAAEDADKDINGLVLFNTMTRAKEPFKPLDPESKKVRFYSCGPTVYNFAHIGNFRAFLTYDVLKRYLSYRGYDVEHVVNITDIDDKIIKRCEAEKTTLEELTTRYTQAFFDDMKLLNIIPAQKYPRATEHIDDMLHMIGELVDQGHAYERDGSVYFKIASFPEYGRLARLDFAGMQVGASGSDADEYDKDNVRDFVLWKAWKPADGDIAWTGQRFGKGRPGWHIECSCMSMKYLGPTLDLHAGGIDLVFPHHENEIAQSEAFSGRAFSRYWLHNGFVNINDEKMSKSLGNFLTLRDIAKTADDARALRYLAVTSYYRSTLNFSAQTFAAAKSTVRRLTALVHRLHDMVDSGAPTAAADAAAMEELVGDARRRFVAAMDDDLNTPRAIAAVFELLSACDAHLTGADAARRLLEFVGGDVDKVLGLFYEAEVEAQGDGEVEELQRLVDERNEARKRKDWGRADHIRNIFADKGYVLEDSPSGTTWKAL